MVSTAEEIVAYMEDMSLVPPKGLPDGKKVRRLSPRNARCDASTCEDPGGIFH